MMWHDPIVEEVRAIREAIADEYGHDLDALCQVLKLQEQKHAERVVILSPRRVSVAAGPARALATP